MNFGFRSSLTLLLLAMCLEGVASAESRNVSYEVWFKDVVVATQTVSIAGTDGITTVTASFAARLPVFIALHPYSEELSATFRADGTVERLQGLRIDGPLRTEVAGELQEDGGLRVVRTDAQGVSTSLIARADYDFHSLTMYGSAPAGFLPTNQPVRILDIAEGRVVPVSIQAIDESETTSERQHVRSTHLVWTSGTLASHSWHPEKFGNVPRRYMRQTTNGEFTFHLPR